MKRQELLQIQRRWQPLPSPFPKVTLGTGSTDRHFKVPEEKAGSLGWEVAAGRAVCPSQSLLAPSSALSSLRHGWKSLITSSLHHVRGFSGPEKSTRPSGGFFDCLFLVLDPAGVGGRRCSYHTLCTRLTAFWEQGAPLFPRFPDNLASLQGALFLCRP